MNYIFCILFSYLLGSIPFAFLLVRFITKSDLRKLGTGNLGAMNSYESTGKKWIGIIVFFLDVIKAFLPVFIVNLISNSDFIMVSLSALFVILGHNYSIFLKFKGGRGLASAVGVSLIISFYLIIVWGIFWLAAFYFLKKDIQVGNIIASVLTPAIYFILPENLVFNTVFIQLPSILTFRIFVLILFLIILIKHIEPLKELISKNSDD